MRQSENEFSNGTNPANPTNSTGQGAGPAGPAGVPLDVPPSSDLWIVFRESFLFYFEPEKRETLRRAGDVVFTSVLSGEVYRPQEPWTHARLRSLARDLLFAVQLLREIGEEPLHSHFEHEEEDRLARSAPAWAEAVERVARLIEEAIDGKAE